MLGYLLIHTVKVAGFRLEIIIPISVVRRQHKVDGEPHTNPRPLKYQHLQVFEISDVFAITRENFSSDNATPFLPQLWMNILTPDYSSPFFNVLAKRMNKFSSWQFENDLGFGVEKSR